MTHIITWHSLLSKEKQMPYFKKILNVLAYKQMMGIIIYPPLKDVFNALKFTAANKVKVVIIGQDPYHGFNQANGLSFSVNPGISIPPSLANIYKELNSDISDFFIPNHGYLKSWAVQGVLLLNTVLTVEAGQSNSHYNLGWELFTDKIITSINHHLENVIFLLWGAKAQKKSILINPKRHYILNASHPSPLSAHISFLGCHHFSRTNMLLLKHKHKPIDWIPKLYN